MADLLQKTIVLALLFILGATGTTVAHEGCSAACEHHSQNVKPSCCAQMDAAMGAMPEHDTAPAPCAAGSCCSLSRTDSEALIPFAVDKDLSVALPVLPRIAVYDHGPQRPSSFLQDSPDTFPPIYKLHCTYLH